MRRFCTAGRAGRPAAPEWMETPDFNVAATETMAYYVARRKGPEPGTEWHREVAYVPPIMVVHHGVTSRRSTDGDGRCRLAHADRRFHDADFYFEIFPHGSAKRGNEKRARRKPPPLMRGTRKQYDMATINGQDNAAQESQGAIVDRSREHLGHSDRGVIQVRKLWLNAIEKSLRGEDLPNLIRHDGQNRRVHVDVVERLVKTGEIRNHVPSVIYVK